MKNISTKLAVFATILVSAFPAFAQEAAHAATTGDLNLKAFGAALGLGIAALGGALGQGRATATALDGIARNPGASGKILVPMILGLAFIESLVIYALVIAFKTT